MGIDDFEHFLPKFDGAGAQGGYERTVPGRFTDERDDRLMHSLISTYALEMKTDDGKASGHFFLDRAVAEAASKEVVQTHFMHSDAKTASWLADHFGATWDHFDVNHDKLIEVERMP